jgi:RNA polymerase-interacting CarD/CdnL/TRCF family regulator
VTSWSERYLENRAAVQSGDRGRLADAIRDLTSRRLTAGERRLLAQALALSASPTAEDPERA